jgi:hypothetical protein
LKCLSKFSTKSFDKRVGVSILSMVSDKKDWWAELGGLPFECTQCGKCCQTKGDVWVNELETQALAKHFELPTQDFICKYAEFEADGWIKLRAKTSLNSESGEGGVGCIFLSDDGKTCTVYPARPKQCTTYPFFPRLLRSPESWNSEVVAPSTAESAPGGRQWTVDSGGCEGMKEVKDIRWNQKKGKWVMKGGGVDPSAEGIIPASEVLRRSTEYEDYFATFPHAALVGMVGPRAPPATPWRQQPA